jgi:succinate dehydrogenase / fumarate reductase flavoprotein subunit
MLLYDIVIIGGGLAGMRAAIEASKYAQVSLLSKVYPTRSHSGAAQGGLNVAISEEDSWQSHSFDTVKGSDYLADQEAVEIFCKEAPQAMYDIDQMGLLFDRKSDGTLDQKFTGGATFPRNCFGGDLSGHKILHTLYEQLLKTGITVHNEFSVIKLITEDNIFQGVVVYDLKQGNIEFIRAKAAILVTGGYGQVFLRTTNDAINTGDGMALALRIGATLQDMEFVQFHPTTLYGSNLLVSETLRGDGGYLLNKDNERFMTRYVPTKMELAPRDIVSRSIQSEIREGRGIDGQDYVHLDVAHLHQSGKFDIIKRFPQVSAIAEKFAGVDIRKQRLPVQPAQHYSMGGIMADVNGETGIKGLFAAGECACISIHGANRLGGNSLMDALVFGKRTGIKAGQFVTENKLVPLNYELVKDEKNRIASIMERIGNQSTPDIRKKLQAVMSNHVGIYRDEDSLKQALSVIEELKVKIGDVVVKDKSQIFNTDLLGYLELEYLLELSEVITIGALQRKESRGSHFRNDYPHRDDDTWLKHTIVSLDKYGKLVMDYKPVSITNWQPAERKY